MFEHTCPYCFSDSASPVRCSHCGMPMLRESAAPMALPMFTALKERYITGALLGVGGFGITYRALDADSGEIVAVKEYMPSALVFGRAGSVPEVYEGREISYGNGLRRFIQEAEILKSMRGEKNIVLVKDCFEENGTAYLVMEMLMGSTLGRLMRTLDAEKTQLLALEMLVSVAGTLAMVHKNGIIHRDVSPENIFITDAHDIKLIDFGTARHYASDDSAKSRSILLKPGFAPPEQYSTKGRQGPWTDIYALAATFYYAVSGVPMPDAMARLEGAGVASLYSLNIGIPRQLSDIVEYATMLDASARLQSAEELIRLLDDVFEPKSPAVIRLSLIKSNRAARVWTFPADAKIVIGRGEDECGVVLNDKIVSRRHLRLWLDARSDGLRIVSTGRNGTSVGGAALVNGTVYSLDNGERFSLCGGAYTFAAEIVK